MSTPRSGGLRPFHPTEFGRFTLLAPLASGGMGQIYLARTRFHGGLEKLCVIKKVLPQLASDPDFISRFLDEARTLVELQHGSIAQVYDTGIEEGEYWIALEFVDGKDLRRLLQRLREKGERLPLPLSLYVAIKILEALAHAHRKRDAAGNELGLVHRDVSPQNVLLSYEGEVKVIDFGLARSTLTGSSDGSVVMGKFHYMAPEQARGVEVDRRADLYALGIVLYEMISGWNPFEDAPRGQVLEWAAYPRIPPVERVSPGLPAAVAIALGQALAIHPADRFQNAEEMRRALSSCLSEFGPEVGPEQLGTLLIDGFSEEYLRERAQIASFARRDPSVSRAADEETQFAPAPQLAARTQRFEGERDSSQFPWDRNQSGGHRALRSAAAAARSAPGELPWYESAAVEGGPRNVPPPPEPTPSGRQPGFRDDVDPAGTRDTQVGARRGSGNHRAGQTRPAPVETQHAPAETRHAPVETRHAPVEARHAPVETRHAPVEARHAPVETQHAPVETRPAPAETHHAPVETRPAPAETRHAPVETRAAVDHTRPAPYLAEAPPAAGGSVRQPKSRRLPLLVGAATLGAAAMGLLFLNPLGGPTPDGAAAQAIPSPAGATALPATRDADAAAQMDSPPPAPAPDAPATADGAPGPAGDGSASADSPAPDPSALAAAPSGAIPAAHRQPASSAGTSSAGATKASVAAAGSAEASQQLAAAESAPTGKSPPDTSVIPISTPVAAAIAPPAPAAPAAAFDRKQLERLRLSVQKKYDLLVERHGFDQVGGIVGELVRAMNSQFDRLIDAPDNYDELHSRLDDLDRLLEERRHAFGQ